MALPTFQRPQVALSIGPTHVAAGAAPGWSLPRRSMRTLPGLPEVVGGEEDGFQPSTLGERLGRALAPWAGRDARLRIMLGDTHCRYLCAPRPEGLRSHQELKDSLDARFEESYGHPASRWVLAYDLPPWGSLDMVVAVDAQVFSTINEAARQTGARAVRIQPAWIGWLARRTRSMTSRPHWLLSRDGRRATVGYFEGGRCLYARSVREGPSSDWPALLARETAFFTGAAENAAVLLAGDNWPAGAASAAPAQPVVLAGTHFWWEGALRHEEQGPCV